jgi:uncharacterized protein YfaP (DUF2135 family)
MVRRALSGSLAIALLSLACSRDSAEIPVAPSPVGSLNVQDIATSASTAGAPGLLRSESAPTSRGGPRITVGGNATIINGGTLAVAITGDAPFNAVYMFIGGRTMGVVGEFGGGIQGHYEMRLPGAQTSASVLLTFPQQLPLDQFDLQFAAANSAGVVGPYSTLSTSVTEVGTGDVQVTLSWDADSDVDLHVVGPGNDEIYYGQPDSPSGGTLDLDSNAGCTLDHVRNENITWPIGRAPRGHYIVRVDYWSSCGVAGTTFSVRVNNSGAVQIATGSFTGNGDRGGLGDGQTMLTFDRSTGPAAITMNASSPSPSSSWLWKKPPTR